jgi:hypothetical protein
MIEIKLSPDGLQEALMSLQECGMNINEIKQNNLEHIHIKHYETLLEFSITTVNEIKKFIDYIDVELEKLNSK